MGNLLDSLQPTVYYSEENRVSEEGEEEFCFEEGKEDAPMFKLSHYLSKEERSYVHNMFTFYFDESEKKFSSSLISDVQKNGNSFIATKMLNFLNSSNIDSPQKLCKFVAECSRIGSTRSSTMLWSIAKHSPDQLSSIEQQIQEFIKFMMSLAQPSISCSSLDQLSPSLLDFYLVKLSIILPAYATAFDLDVFLSIVYSYAPHAYRAFQSYIIRNFLTWSNDHFSSFHHFDPIQLSNESGIVNPVSIALLSMHSQELQGSWQQIYNSNSDGRSFDRIVFSLLGYEGPTCLLIKCGDRDNSVLGFFSAEKWRDNNRFYGSSNNFIFTLSPRVRLYKTLVTAPGNYQWLNTGSFGLPHGLGFGGDLNAFRIFIPDSFEDMETRDSCLTYEPGHLASENKFEIDSIEIWACGGEEKIQKGLSAQLESREISKSNIEKARKVDKAAFFNSGFDREFLLANTFAHQKQTERPDVD